jgi:hypothetical protein
MTWPDPFRPLALHGEIASSCGLNINGFRNPKGNAFGQGLDITATYSSRTKPLTKVNTTLDVQDMNSTRDFMKLLAKSGY